MSHYRIFYLVSEVGGGTIEKFTECQRWKVILYNIPLDLRGGKTCYRIFHSVSEVGGRSMKYST